MQSTDNNYVNHQIFEDLSYYAQFYEYLSDAVMSFTTIGTTAIINIDTYVFMSMKGTIQSINLVLKEGKLNDAYALLRKYYDSVMVNAYTNLYISDNAGKAGYYITEINDWLHGKKPLPRMPKMSKYLDSSAHLSKLNSLLKIDKRYDDIRDRCNDNMHYNFFALLMLNDGTIYMKDRLRHLEQLRVDVRDVFILNMSYILTINESYMMSSDYVDHLDVGMTPPEGSQYWVAPFIQDMASDVLLVERPDIFELLKSQTCMELD
ncbi:hypothetical protein [Shewanella xiamenensis]|uniref:hypothetical protein n=1 Tax=Shewanella xiamenensis TaxID=332186 RepID=UPI000C12BD74|nr:hypothetical protein [Shewanella xiamenensis]MCT8861919.1 hypothetical protein [Shewanella xiamenensis]MCT8874552.1 hypothetical protein [Shewanella xiamenensis]PHY62863.1 hypothetical protein CS023_13455 [Shewanella xiamenensis]PZP27256.1 MAG: hypothetical protein DI594_21140 [Shewanella oneidensis]